MKLQYIAAALGLVASASSFATIQPPSTLAAGELGLFVWEQGAANGKADQSFAFDTGITVASFLASKNSSSTLATLASSDSTWQTFLSSSDAGSLNYAVFGGNGKSPAQLFTTVKSNADDLAFVPLATSSQVTSGDGVINSYLASVNDTGTHLTQANGESINAVGTDAYFMTYNQDTQNQTFAFSNSNAVGTAANAVNMAAAPRGGMYSYSFLPGQINFASSGNNSYVLSYSVAAAVPEASGYLMSLAGIGLLGFVGLRRRNR